MFASLNQPDLCPRIAMFMRGQIVSMKTPVSLEDKRIAAMKMGRSAAFIEYTKPHGFARVTFYGDAKGLTYLVHPESLAV